MSARIGWLWVGVLALAGGAALVWQQTKLVPLRAEMALLRGRQAEWSKLRAEQKRLAALQVPAAELESLRIDHAAVARLRGEIDAMRSRLEQASKSATPEKTDPDRLSVGKDVPTSEWRNVGSHTPPAALETALWAAAGGDVDAFAGLLMFDAAARKAAQALLDSLPAEMRARYGSPERLIAFLTIKDVPLGSAKVRGWSGVSESKIMMASVILSTPEGKLKDVALPLVREEQGWKLFVIERTVAKYAAMLKAPAAAVGGK